jgi:hypothetical protein
VKFFIEDIVMDLLVIKAEAETVSRVEAVSISVDLQPEVYAALVAEVAQSGHDFNTYAALAIFQAVTQAQNFRRMQAKLLSDAAA